MSGSRLSHLKEPLSATRAQVIAASLGKFDLLRALGKVTGCNGRCRLPLRGRRPISAKTYVSVLHAMSWVGLAAAGEPAAEERLKAEFDVTHAHDALDGAFA